MGSEAAVLGHFGTAYARTSTVSWVFGVVGGHFFEVTEMGGVTVREIGNSDVVGDVADDEGYLSGSLAAVRL